MGLTQLELYVISKRIVSLFIKEKRKQLFEIVRGCGCCPIRDHCIAPVNLLSCDVHVDVMLYSIT